METRGAKLFFIFLVLLICGGVLTALAFTGPSSPPPSGNGLIFASPTGNVGIGTSAPSYKLDVSGNISGTQLCIGTDCRSSWSGIGGAYWGLGTDRIYYVSSTRPRVSIGISNPSEQWYFMIDRTATETIPGDNILTGSNYWVDSSLVDNVSAHFKGLYGFVGGNTADHFGSFIGSHGFGSLSGTGIVDNIIGSMGTARISNGQSSRLTGLNAQIVMSGGTASSASGLFVESPSMTGGTLTNLRGIYMNDQNIGSATNKYAFYYDGASKVVITAASNVGIGTTTPQTALEVNGGIRLATVTAKPSCSVTIRGTLWFTRSAAGIKDSLEVCAKDASNAYAWRLLY